MSIETTTAATASKAVAIGESDAKAAYIAARAARKAARKVVGSDPARWDAACAAYAIARAAYAEAFYATKEVA